MKTFNIPALTLSAGILWALGVFCLAFLSMYFDIATPIVELLASGYKGLSATWGGALAGAVWGFFDAAVGAAIFGWLYNYFAKKFK